MKLINKVVIKGQLEVLTGLHIGGNSSFSAIGSADSPVVKDRLTGLPMIPGSSLKGKLRSLLSRSFHNKPTNVEDEKDELKRLFGSSEPVMISRLIFRDAFLNNLSELPDQNPTEIKFENTIDRVTLQANPRQIERVISGSQFDVEIVYNIEEDDEVIADLKNILLGLELLHLDYLGGHGTRGSGRVRINNLKINDLSGKLQNEQLEALTAQYSEVDNYGNA